MKKLVSNLTIGVVSLYLAASLVPNVYINSGDKIKIIVLAGLTLGVLNFFLRPIINLIALPLRILTFGLFGLIINMGLVWIIDIIFNELVITGIKPLFFTGLIVWILNILISKITK